MRNTMIRQAQFVPLAAILVVIFAGIAMPGYSSTSQHISELGLLDHPLASVMHLGAMIAGASVVTFGVGLKLHLPKAFNFTPLAAVVFGVSYFASGIFHSGDPLHGLYGLVMFYVVVPAFFAAELPAPLRTRFIVKASLLAALLSLGYMWFMFSGLEPHGGRGLTQRLAALVIFGWYSLASYALLRGDTLSVSRTANSVAPAVG